MIFSAMLNIQGTKDHQVFSFPVESGRIQSFSTALIAIKTGKKKKQTYIVNNTKKNEVICVEKNRAY